MPIPDYQFLMLPVLKASANGEVRIGVVVESLAHELKLTNDERAQLLPSGWRARCLGLKMPHAPSESELWNQTLLQFHPESLEAEKIDAIRALDDVVSAALGLTSKDLETIWRECSNDPSLKRIVPRYPGTTTRKQGFRAGLGTSDRYQ